MARRPVGLQGNCLHDVLPKEDVVLGFYYEVYDRNMLRDPCTHSLLLKRSRTLAAIRPTAIVTTVTVHPYYEAAPEATAGAFLVNRYEHFPRYTEWYGDPNRVIMARCCVPLSDLEEQVVVRILAHMVDEQGMLNYQVCTSALAP
jgi:hypothetical protein